MLGWRPFLLSGVALLLIAVAALDASTAGRSSPASCGPANKLRDGGLISEARKAYVAILKSEPKSACALAGVRQVTSKDCERLRRIATTDPAAARTLLLADAKADPPPAASSCVWTRLAALPAAGS
jgi:hypothetical protein